MDTSKTILVVIIIVLLAFVCAKGRRRFMERTVTNPVIEKLDTIKAQNDSIFKELKMLNEYLYD